MHKMGKEEWEEYIENKILSVRREVDPFTSIEQFARECEEVAIEIVKYCNKDLTNIEYENPGQHIIGIINGMLVFGMMNEEDTEKCATWYVLWVEAIMKKIKEGQDEEQIRDFLREKQIYDEIANAIINDARIEIANDIINDALSRINGSAGVRSNKRNNK